MARLTQKEKKLKGMVEDIYDLMNLEDELYTLYFLTIMAEAVGEWASLKGQPPLDVQLARLIEWKPEVMKNWSRELSELMTKSIKGGLG